MRRIEDMDLAFIDIVMIHHDSVLAHTQRLSVYHRSVLNEMVHSA